MHQADVYRMIRRRARDAGIRTPVGRPTFRATGTTSYLVNGGTLARAQFMAAQKIRPDAGAVWPAGTMP